MEIFNEPDAGLRKIFADRHWMHIWKAGHKGCIVCNKDARAIVSYIDAADEIVKQEFLCELHGPWTGRSGRESVIDNESTTEEQFINDVKFRLGGSFSISSDE